MAKYWGKNVPGKNAMCGYFPPRPSNSHPPLSTQGDKTQLSSPANSIAPSYLCGMNTATLQSPATARLSSVLSKIVSDRQQHARLLNTLSYMEHIGATKIARTQSGPWATFMSLKHAAEEARHAFYLKKLSLKLAPGLCPDYAFGHLLAPLASRHYLQRLDVAASRLCKSAGLKGKALHDLSYLLVTYAIEIRADEIYPVYELLLEHLPERISVSSIIAEEEGHLAEMISALAEYPVHLREIAEDMRAIEEGLFTEWLKEIERVGG
jgi:hypothetical protein